MEVHLVSSTDSDEFTHLTRALSRSTVIGLDAEWKPIRSQQSTFPTVTLLQLACQLGDDTAVWDESVVFLLDLALIPLPSIYELLKDVFVSPDILKLGFRFKQDLIFLSSTFSAQGCNPGFDKVEPYMDITNIYKLWQHKQGKKVSKDTKSLSAICEEVLGTPLSKELQCSDWSHRPLTEDQIRYAASDAHCLLGIFKTFKAKIVKEGLKEILTMPDSNNKVVGTKFCNALDIVQATASSEDCERIAQVVEVVRNTKPMDESLLKIVRKYGEKILLRESDRKPKSSKRKGRKRSSVVVCREKKLEIFSDWQGPPPWDISLGGDGCPKFLCDVMVEGLAKHLRCVGVDAAIPHSKRPEPRELIDQACREKRVLLTRDAKLLRHQYLIKNQIYRVNNLLKNEQLLEVIEIFQLKISEDQLMSRCTKCNGRFIQKPLTTEEAIEAAKGFQRIPNCLFDKNLEFWQCMECNQLYWEGTQYHNAVQKFIDVCKLNE
ncbi:hypothetical protein COLO4_16809 [Corchorus olitorius]|uniref:3'-5' exonuclease domain-containing protein n=1 Tax=Corchorus olitorius TaxID=93759 RepID=A0A1R3JFE7_9ROSI|nr:hypothetical protein COLO4_16809 [Corchorus olitorius]